MSEWPLPSIMWHRCSQPRATTWAQHRFTVYHCDLFASCHPLQFLLRWYSWFPVLRLYYVLGPHGLWKNSRWPSTHVWSRANKTLRLISWSAFPLGCSIHSIFSPHDDNPVSSRLSAPDSPDVWGVADSVASKPESGGLYHLDKDCRAWETVCDCQLWPS